jgi:hypothetical protein
MHAVHGQGSPFSARELALLRPGEFHALGANPNRVLDTAQARYLLEFSRLAPSAHNTVPAAFRLGTRGDALDVFLRPEFVLDASDPTGEEALISVGCAVEAFVMAAARYGVACAWRRSSALAPSDVLPARGRAPVHVGTLELSRAGDFAQEPDFRALEALIERQVVRAEYDRALTLPAELAAALEAAVAAVAGVSLLVFQTSAQKFAWAKLDEMATKHELEQAPFRAELGAWLLSNRDVTSTRGMRGHEFGLDDAMTSKLRAELSGDVPLETDQLANLARASRIGIVSSSALGVLSTRDDAADGAMLVGRAFQRAAVTLVQHGFSCALHTAICQVPYVRAMAQASLTRGARPKLLFRMGKPLSVEHARRPRSSRPPLEELLLTSTERAPT